jgi:hypothetical protein
MRVGWIKPALTWDNEAGPKGAGNTRRSLTALSFTTEEGLMPQRTHVPPTNTRSPRLGRT